MKELLFVRGHNTDFNKPTDIYECFTEFLDEHNINVTYVNYTLDDDICEVYTKMCRKIKKNKYDFIVGHSMGGCLVMRYIYDYPKQISTIKKCVLLMPLVSKVPVYNFLANISLTSHISVPKWIIYPENKLYDGGNVFNDTTFTKMIPLTQIVDCYKNLMLDDDAIIRTLNKHINCVMFYATGENFTNITQSILEQLDNLIMVNGKHECFLGDSKSADFFKQFYYFGIKN